jgi:hypothetical protein
MSNFSFPNLIVGIIGVILGGWVVKESYYINHHILFLGWAENKWGPGAGTTFYRLVGAGVCVFAVFVMLGYIDMFGMAFGGSSSSSGQNGSAAPVFQGGGGGTVRNRIAD